jgi:signal transduction histidine kinase
VASGSVPNRAVIVGALALSAKVALSIPRLPDQAPAVAITWLTVISFIVIGLTLMASSLPNISGWACLAVAWATVPGDLNDPHYLDGGLTWIGYVLEPIYLPAALGLVLRYPRSRLTTFQRGIVWSMLVASVGSRIPTALTTGNLPDGFYRPRGFPTIALDPFWHDQVFMRGGRGITVALLLLSGALLTHRAVSAIGLTRQSLAPLAIVTAICAFAASVDQAIWVVADPAFRGIPAALVRDLSAAMIPVALLADLLRRRAAGAQVAERVLVAAGSGDPEALQASLREALVDPSLTVVVVGGSPTADALARHTDLVDSQGRRRGFAQVMGDHDEPLLSVSYNPKAIPDAALFETALKAARYGLDNTRLNAQLRANLEELKRSRTRIVEATLEERRRVERNLHDGAQQQFLSVAALLARVDLVDADEAKHIVTQARSQLQDALAELRRLAQGIHPSALSQGGLGPALHTLREAAPLAMTLTIDPQVLEERPRPAVEAAAYFTAAEALANVVKHASASHCELVVGMDGDRLSIVMRDNGTGGVRIAPGGGLDGLKDRLGALGGTLWVHTDPCAEHPHATGSTLRAIIPPDREAT